ncbi:MAG: Uma2 family endonuclease [Proteobacteria bacterium]|jgi:Uma2 family endonuclease|nr:Uma2 family endonuclease [Pseudomonadota bacterium]
MAKSQTRTESSTYGDYRTWPDDERWEIIEGVPCAMTPAPTRRHQEILGRLFLQIASQLQGRTCKVYFAPFDVRLPGTSEDESDDDTVVQPDLSVICDPAKLDRKGCRGAPDFVVEVISPSTTSHDQITKSELYERHGVREYWIVHPADRLVFVRRQQEQGGYGAPLILEAKGTLEAEVLPGVTVNLDEVFTE